MGNNCCRGDDLYYDSPSQNRDIFKVNDLQPVFSSYPATSLIPGGPQNPQIFNVNSYVPRNYPLVKDDEPLPQLQLNNPDRPPYAVDVSIQFAWMSFKPKNDHHDIPCALVLNAPEQPFSSRAGVDIICVIDVSGSMEEDEKLILVKRTLNFMINNLSEIDRLCIISFNDRAQKLMPLSVMNNYGKTMAATVVSYLRAGGGTNIVEGLQTALTVAQNRNMLNYTLDIMMLSDGVDNHQESSLYRARDCFMRFDQLNMSYSVHAFGYGHSHDSELLGDIAHIKNGGFYYVEEAEDIRHAFSHCLGEILSVVARDIRVSLLVQPCPIPFTLSQVHSECGTMNFRMPNISSGTSKEAIFILSFPPCRVAIQDGSITPIKAVVSFIMVNTGEIINVERDLSIDIRNNTRNIELYKGVMIHFYRVKTAECLRIAGELGAQHRFDEARDVLSNGIYVLKKSEYHNDAFVKHLIRDLENSKHKLKGHHTWHRGGHAHFRHIHHGHWAKRGEKHDFYNNERQRNLKNQAQNYF